MPDTEAYPKVYSIAAGEAFADVLARGILDRYADGKNWQVLPDVRILVPTRRAVLAVQDSFQRLAQSVGQEAVLLPKIQPLGDVDEGELLFSGAQELGAHGIELPPAVSGLRRDLILAKLIVEWSVLRQKRGLTVGTTDLSHGLRLARDLGHFIDGFETENVDPAKLGDLVPGDYAELWQENLEFLKIVTEVWPRILENDLSAVDGVERRNLLLGGLADKWRQNPPGHPVVAAGSTGSIPATAALMNVIARLPQGAVILPGLDMEMDDRAWKAVESSHPQTGMKDLLDRLQIERSHVDLWGGADDPGSASRSTFRRRFIHAGLRPAAATDDWRDVVESFSLQDWDLALDGLMRIDAAHPGEEALTIALILRECLERPDQTAALVTPDRELARRVAANLRRWEIEIDDSAGQPLPQTEIGIFLRLVVSAAQSDLEAVALLSLLKHPFCKMVLDRKSFRNLIWQFETLCLRGPAPQSGIAGLRHRLERALDRSKTPRSATTTGQLYDLIDWLDRAFAPLIDLLGRRKCTLGEAVRAHILCAEQISGHRNDGADTGLWSGEAGESAAVFLRSLLDDSHAAPDFEGEAYLSVFETLMSGQVVRAKFGQHPRLFIWGPLEARLQKVDTAILGGLNEGVWPATAKMDPWLSRPMRQMLELPLPERRIGLSAHDFAQLSCLPRVFLTRSERLEGAPTVASRWLLRLETLLRGAGRNDSLNAGQKYLEWARRINEPEDPNPWEPPQPRPPVDARPRRFSVTEIETWIRDPYAIYAKKILGLRPLDPIATAPDRMQRGVLIHTILEAFAHRFPDQIPDNAYDELIAIGQAAFESIADEPEVYSFWWPRFEHVAEWFVANEKMMRQERHVEYVHSEKTGTFILPGPAGEFVLTARADRIDQQEGGAALYDYKTGNPPSAKQVKSFLTPQLPLEALILAEGGFDGLPQSMPSALSYIRLKGGDDPGQVIDIAIDRDEVAELVAAAKDGLINLISSFDLVETPYRSQPRVQFKSAYTDYDHLARAKEWPTSSRMEQVSKL